MLSLGSGVSMTYRLVPIVGVVCSLALGSWSATARAQWKEDKPASGGATSGGWGNGDKPVAQPSTGWGFAHGFPAARRNRALAHLDRLRSDEHRVWP